MSPKVSLVLILQGLLASSMPTGGLPPAKLCQCGQDLAACGACGAGWAQRGVQSGLTPMPTATPPEEDGSFNGLFSPVIDGTEDSEVAKVVRGMPQTVHLDGFDGTGDSEVAKVVRGMPQTMLDGST